MLGGPVSPFHVAVALVERGAYVARALPAAGRAVIGRAPGATIRLEDAAAEPEHAELIVSAEGVRVAPLAGYTMVNGEPLAAARALANGDVLVVGEATLVVRIDAAAARVLRAGDMRRRLDAEVERAVRYARPLAVLVIAGVRDAELGALSDAVVEAVRKVDVVGAGDDRDLVVLMPETSAEAASVPARRVLAAARAHVAEARIGVAACPANGCDAETLVAEARAAARSAGPGGVGEVPLAPRAWTAGDVAIVARDPAMTRVLAIVERLAASDITVLIGGETGAGKEVIAKALHAWSPRHDAPLVALNCAAVPESLLESELFGHERGAFSGATAAKPGLLESATGGTVFLDEVGECSPSAQAKLLRVLETRRVTRLGSLAPRPIDVRIVAATNRALEDEVAAGRFRQDLFFRLCTATVLVPPLRERPLDVAPLAQAFLDEACARERRGRLVLTARALERLAAYGWPGNVRELRNLMAVVAATAVGPEVDDGDLSGPTRSGCWRAVGPASAARVERVGDGRAFRPLYEEIRELERARIAEALDACGGVRTRAAELIGMPLRTLVTKIKEYGLADGGARRRARQEVSGT